MAKQTRSLEAGCNDVISMRVAAARCSLFSDRSSSLSGNNGSGLYSEQERAEMAAREKDAVGIKQIMDGGKRNMTGVSGMTAAHCAARERTTLRGNNGTRILKCGPVRHTGC